MALIAPGVARFSLNGTTFGGPWTTVLDFFIDTTGTGLSRSDACFSAAGNIINSWVEHVAPITAAQTQLNEVAWVDLDSESGSTGQRSTTSLHTLPRPGTAVGDSSPRAVALLVTKVTTSGRGLRNGRMYLPGMRDNTVTGASTESAFQTAAQSAMNGYLAELNDEPALPTNFDRRLVVVHTRSVDPDTGAPLPEPEFVSETEVESLVVQSLLATQRRRQR